MEIKCELERSKEILKDIKLNVERYSEIVKNFYDTISSFNAHGWTGTAAINYAEYLENKKKDFDLIYSTLRSFEETARKNVEELESAINSSKVSDND